MEIYRHDGSQQTMISFSAEVTGFKGMVLVCFASVQA
jgi:hypothetical protein